MKLSDGEIGKTYTVINIDLQDQVKRHLEILGMTEKSKLSVLNKKRHGAMIVKFRGTRFAVGKKFADGIEVG